MPKTPKQPRIITQHDYVSLVLGSRRLTTSYGGCRVCGDVPKDVSDLWFNLFGSNNTSHSQPLALARIGLPQGGNIGEKVKAFADHIDTIWPEWRDEAQPPTIGQTYAVDLGRRDGILNGVAKSIQRQNATLDFGTNRLISIPFSMLRPPIPTV